MITALLILALVVATIGTAGVIGVCIGEGFWFWLLCGQHAIKLCFAGIVGLLSLLNDVNS